jgi:hypothetical protein
MNSQRTLINILGAGRSGSTMLDLMLGNDEMSFSLGEIHAWFRPFRRHHHKIDCNCGNPECTYWKKILYIPAKDFHAVAFERLGKQFLIDSSKNLPWVMDNNRWAARNNIRVINFIIYKPLVSYIHSVWKRGESVDAALYRYKTYYSRFIEACLPACSISFTELVNQPDETLQRLCSITGQPYRLDRKEFWRGEYHHMFGSGGIRNQTRRGSAKVESVDLFSEEFNSLLPRIKQLVETDDIIKMIREELDQIDHKFRNLTMNEFPNMASQNRVKPTWYYTARAKSAIRRWVPQRYEPK